MLQRVLKFNQEYNALSFLYLTTKQVMECQDLIFNLTFMNYLWNK